MPRIIAVLALAAILVGAASPAGAWPSPHSLGSLAYVSPAPGSARHNAATNVIVRPGGALDAASFGPSSIEVSGSVSGSHTGTLRLSDDGETLVLRPDTPFAPGETVTCSIAAGLETVPGGSREGETFTFEIAPLEPPSVAMVSPLEDELGFAPGPLSLRGGLAPSARADSIPADLPEVSTVVSGTPAEGVLFLCDIRFDDGTYRSHLMVLRDDGTPVFARGLRGSGYDFKAQQNGRVTYFDAAAGRFYAMNANFALVDSFECGNGYVTDIHELQLLPNGHALLMAYDPRTVDLSGVVPGGSTQAVVLGLIVQELDRHRDVVFQWRSWDHFQITDCVSRPLTGARVDYVHGNAIERDADGNLLVSSRHLDEITKIDRATGEILWRLGGVNNEFTFTNDPGRFSQQHSIRRLANGHLLLYDNGNYHVPALSRAVEYSVDEVAKTATVVWEYRNVPDVYSSAMGSVERLANGNTVIGWGNTSPALTEVTPSGAEVFELALPPAVYSYRAFRSVWPPVLPASVALRSGAVVHASQGGTVTIDISGEGFAPDSIIPESVRLDGVPAEGFVPPAFPGGAATFRFPADPLLASHAPGQSALAFAGSLVSGERIHGVVDVTIEGSRRVGARMASAIGSVPIRLALRATASPRTVRLAAYDIRGRRVAEWTADVDASGIVSWDGRGPDRAPLPSGIYYVRTEGAALTETAKVILAR
ncbi:MAG TPA: aryl-sulfate sulfotransferase [Candidatus Eisenbacteria bacterium]|nr:aryl-sulfate sulfotransferase [Candidatus Eisenbacteria bacterium]